MMKKYQVKIQVIGIANATIGVEAHDAAMALKQAEDILYNSEIEWEFELNHNLPPKMSVETLADE